MKGIERQPVLYNTNGKNAMKESILPTENMKDTYWILIKIAFKSTTRSMLRSQFVVFAAVAFQSFDLW